MTIGNIVKHISKSFKKKRPRSLGIDRFATNSEVKRFLTSFDKDKERHYEVIFHLLAFTNLRPCEACELKITSFTKDLNKASVWQTKTEQFKTTIIPPFLMDYWTNFIEENMSNIMRHDGYIFYVDNPNSTVGHLTPASLRWKLWEKRIKLGINDFVTNKKTQKNHYRVGVYSMRRHFISNLCENPNTMIQDVSDIVGHSDPRITMKYRRKRSDDWKTDVINKVFLRIKEEKLVPNEQSFLHDFREGDPTDSGKV